MAKDSNSFLSFLKWFDVTAWFRDMYRQARDWNVVRKVCKEEATKRLFAQTNPEIRVDRIFRLYTVVNIPEELYPKEYEGARQTFLIDELRKVEEITLRLGISEILYPEYVVITDVPDSFAYLLVLETNKDSFEWMEFFKWLLQFFSLSFVLLIINQIVQLASGHGILHWLWAIMPF